MENHPPLHEAPRPPHQRVNLFDLPPFQRLRHRGRVRHPTAIAACDDPTIASDQVNPMRVARDRGELMTGAGKQSPVIPLTRSQAKTAGGKQAICLARGVFERLLVHDHEDASRHDVS
jgi:hypothetical protein